MTSEVKARMLAGTMTLLARNGVQATSFSEVIKETGVPRGSIYHHFPNGKDQMISEAMESTAEIAFSELNQFFGTTPEKITKEYFKLWRSGFANEYPKTGCPILAVIVSSNTDELRSQAGEVFKKWREQLGALLQSSGLTQKKAKAFAILLLASVQGSVVISRGDESIDAFDLVAEQMISHAKTLS